MTLNIEKLLNLVQPSDAQLSPDGKQIAFVMGKSHKADKESPHERSIHVLDIESGGSVQVTDVGTCTNTSPRWSPDGKYLAFLSNRANKKDMQIYIMGLNGGKAQVLTDLQGQLQWIQWSADGQTVSFLYNGSLDKQPQDEPDPIVYDSTPKFNRIWTVDVETHELKAITPENYHIHEYVWSPDQTRFAALASQHPNPMQGWYTAQLYIASADGKQFEQLCTIPHQIGRLVWSPDSQSIAYVSGVMSDEGNIAGEVYSVSVANGEPQNLTPGIDHSITWIDWQPNGIYYGARHIEAGLIGYIDGQSGEIHQVIRGMYAIGGRGPEKFSICGTIITTIRESYTETPNIYIGSLESDDWKQVSHLDFDTGCFPLLHIENVHWTHADGTPTHAYLAFPEGYEAGKPYPMVVNVHGGPSLSIVPGYANNWVRLFLDKGCLVLLPNPRGSWGRGHDYQAANVGDLGGGDWQDVMAGIDKLVEDGVADPDQLAIAGWSYAGFLTTWAVTQTDRFRCAIAGANITNYVSNYAVVRNRDWQSTMFGSNVYDDMALHWSRSPIQYVNQVKTPTLLVHGAEDLVAPPEQSIEFHIALKHFGIPTELVLYPREPHGFQEYAHQLDLLERMSRWLDTYLLG